MVSPRSIYRWKSFWLGLLVLIFLGWAWVRSTHRMDSFSYKGSTFSRTWAGTHGLGVVHLLWWKDRFAVEGLNLYSTSAPSHLRLKSTWFPKPVALSGGSQGGADGITISHWFLILLFLVPWTGFLFWRVRRMRRAGKLPPPVEN